METQGFLHVPVPILPRVGSGEFFVFVRDLVFLRESMEGSVVVEQIIFGAAVDSDMRQRGLGLGGQRQGLQVVLASARCFAEDTKKFAERFLFANSTSGFESARMAVGADEEVGARQGEAERAVPAHGQTADAATSALAFDGKGAFDEAEHIVEHVATVGGAFGVVGVEASKSVGHDDGKRKVFGVTFNGGSAGPGVAVVAETMKQVVDGKRAVAFFRQNYFHLHVLLKGLAEEVTREQGHVSKASRTGSFFGANTEILRHNGLYGRTEETTEAAMSVWALVMLILISKKENQWDWEEDKI